MIVGTTISSDGRKAYRKLPTIGFNKTEGFWDCFKRWLPSSGPYNLEQYLSLYLWFQYNKIHQVNPFWALVELVKQNNSIEVMNAALGILPDSEGFEYSMEQEEAENEATDDSDASDDSSDSDESDPNTELSKFPCPFCTTSFDNQDDAFNHVEPDQNINGGEDLIINMEESPSAPSVRNHSKPRTKLSSTSWYTK